MLGQSLREVHSEEHCQRLEPYVPSQDISSWGHNGLWPATQQ